MRITPFVMCAPSTSFWKMLQISPASLRKFGVSSIEISVSQFNIIASPPPEKCIGTMLVIFTRLPDGSVVSDADVLMMELVPLLTEFVEL